MRTGPHRNPLLLILPVAIAIIGATVALTAGEKEQFPHERHARLFPLCEGCHAGIESGDVTTAFPSPQMCRNCHDGEQQRRVDWQGATEHPSNLEFTHPQHRAALASAGDAALDCAQCHTPEGAPRMTVVRADPPVCLSCHGHPANDHFTDAECSTCHVAYAHSTLPPSRMLSLPVPADHREPGFVLEGHGRLASGDTDPCTVCHTRARCEACHVNASDVPAIAEIPAAPAAWTLPQFIATYPVPASHLSRDWVEDHGAGASRTSCAACHARESCTTCHVEPVPAVIETLPRGGELQVYSPSRRDASLAVAVPAAELHARDAVVVQDTGRRRAAGVTTTRRMPASHASRYFQTRHAAMAAAQPQTCNACHTRTFCTDCHQAPAAPTYHPVNFTLQHASAGWSRRLECATCHETRTFCRSCHIGQGLEAEGRLGTGYHDAEPLWLLRHARAARQGLESCTACHQQRDCMQCHSELGAFRVNPHGPDFNARRAQQRNPVICLACHISDPLQRGVTP